MNVQLTYLALTALLTAALWIPYIVCQVMTNGFLSGENYVDPTPRPVPLWGQRAYRAHLNAVEAFAPFAALILIAHVAGKESAMTAFWAAAFFWIRLAHALASPVRHSLCAHVAVHARLRLRLRRWRGRSRPEQERMLANFGHPASRQSCLACSFEQICVVTPYSLDFALASRASLYLCPLSETKGCNSFSLSGSIAPDAWRDITSCRSKRRCSATSLSGANGGGSLSTLSASLAQQVLRGGLAPLTRQEAQFGGKRVEGQFGLAFERLAENLAMLRLRGLSVPRRADLQFGDQILSYVPHRQARPHQRLQCWQR